MEAEIAEKRSARQQELDYSPFSASVTSVVIVSVPDVVTDDLSHLIIEHNTQVSIPDAADGRYRPGELSYNALKKMAELLDYDDGESAYRYAPGIACADMASIVGIRIRQKLQLMAADAMRYCAVWGLPFDIPSVLWCHPNFRTPIWMDPYEVVVPADQRQWVRYEQLADYLCIERPSANMEDDAAEQVRFAVRITRAANL